MSQNAAMEISRLRAWYAHRQGLLGELEGKTSREIFVLSGWARSVAGANPYLTVFSRAGISREQVDRDLANLEIAELPSARGCTYVLPRDDFQLGLLVGRPTGTGAEMKVASKLGVTDEEITLLGWRVLEVLRDGPMDPAAIRTAVGDAARSLGEEGKKKGLTTTLPVALGILQTRGEILRKSLTGRFDSQRYAYALWENHPFINGSGDVDAANREVARKYFRWAGPTTVGEFATFLGLGVKASKTVTEGLDLAPVEAGSDKMVLAEDLPEFEAFVRPAEPAYKLVSGLDSLFLLRRDMDVLFEEADRATPFFKDSTLALMDIQHNAILDRGRCIGFWDYDPEAKEIVWVSFVGRDDALRAEVARTEAFCRDQLGDARSFSLDSPESRKPRLEFLRSLPV